MRAKILKAFFMIVSVLLISEIYILVSHYVITDKYQQMTDVLIAEYQLIEDSSKLVNSFYDLIQYSNDQQRLQAFRNNLDSLQALLNKLDMSLAGGESWTVYLGVKNTVIVLINDVNAGLENISAGNFSEVTARYFKATSDNSFVRENTSGLIIKELENVKNTQAAVRSTDLWSKIIGLLLFIIITVGSLLYSLAFSKKLINPLSRLAEFSKKIRNGNYEEKMDASLKSGNTEVGTLAESLESIAITLKDNIKTFETKDAQLAQTIRNLTDHAPHEEEPGEAEKNESKPPAA